ncbi:MAG: DUF4190 domain-containing protein [Nocardioidaceae bacterium]
MTTPSDFDPDAYYGDPEADGTPDRSAGWVAPGPVPADPAPPATPPSVGETPTAPYPQPYPQAPYPQQPYPQQPPAYQQPPASAATPPSVPCTGYGAPPSYYVGVGVPQVANRLATTSLVIGIVSVVVSLACCSLLSVFGIAAIVCGVVARRQIAASLGYQTGAGLALAGIITGAIAVLIGTGMFLLLFAVSPGSLS